MTRLLLAVALGGLAACASAAPTADVDPAPASAPAAGPPATATPPELGAPPRLSLPEPQEVTLANGLTLKLVEMREVPVVQAVLSIEGGAQLDGDIAGLATFTANMLDEGAGTRDAFELAEELEYLGASLSTGAGWDAMTLSLRAPSRTFDDALGLLADVVLRPTLAAEDIARQRDLRIASILAARDQPAAVASDVFGYTVYPATHPYHRPLGGDSISTTRLDSATVRAFWTRVANPARATLVLAGAISLADAQRAVEAALGGWRAPAGATARANAVAEAPRPETRVFLVDKPEAAQSIIMIGAPGVERRSDDYAKIVLMNTILGGSFSARLNDILREQKGFTYGAFSNFTWRPVPGPFVASAAVRTDVTDSSLAIVLDEFRRIRAEPVSAAELDRARSYVTLGALGDYETTGQVASTLAGLDLFGIPLTQVPEELEQVRTLDAAAVQAAATRYLDPDHMTVVVVGDIAKIRPGVEALGLGPVTILDHAGREVE